MRDGAYNISFDEKQSKGMHWVILLIYTYAAVYFDSLGIQYIPQDV